MGCPRPHHCRGDVRPWEGLDEHNETTHSLLNYDSTLRVPLVIAIPGMEPVRIERAVGTVDIAPTILDALGLESGAVTHGSSLLPLIEEQSVPDWYPPVQYYAETLSSRVSHGWGELRTLVDQDYKYIHGPRPELYRWREDPGELNDLVNQESDVAEAMKESLAVWIADLGAAQASSAVTVDEETLARLQALGYVQGSGDTGQIIEVLRDEGAPPQDRVHHVSNLSRAKGAIAGNRPLEAQVALQNLLADDPDNVAYIRLAAAASVQLGQIEQAEAYLRSLIDKQGLEAMSAATILQLANLRRTADDYAEAIDLLQQHLQANPTAGVAFELGRLHQQQGEVDAAIRAYRTSIELQPNDVLARSQLALLLDVNGETEAARDVFQEAMALQPYMPSLHYNYGVFAWAHGDLDLAREKFDRAIALDPNYKLARNAAAVAAHQQDDVARTQLELAWFIEHHPNAPETNNLKQMIGNDA